jgi:hypothetical protein
MERDGNGPFTGLEPPYRHSNEYNHADSDAHANFHSEPNIYTHPHGDSNLYFNAHTNCNRYRYIHAHPYANRHCYAHPYGICNFDKNGNLGANANKLTNIVPHTATGNFHTRSANCHSKTIFSFSIREMVSNLLRYKGILYENFHSIYIVWFPDSGKYCITPSAYFLYHIFSSCSLAASTYHSGLHIVYL